MSTNLQGPRSGIIPPQVCAPDDMSCRLRHAVDAGPAAIDERLAQLESAWTAGRASKAAAGVLIVAGTALGLAVSPWWFLLPIVGGAVLLQYLFERQSLLGAMFRKMGLPSGADVEQEKLALRALRGDFQNLPTVHQVVDQDAITRLEGEGGIVYEPEEDSVDADIAVRSAIFVARS